VSAGVTVNWAVQAVAGALDTARAAPIPAAVEAAGAVASACLRLLRDPAQVAASSSAGEGSVPQPSVAALEAGLLTSYSAALTALLSERHPHITAAFFKNALPGAPVLSVRLLPTLAAALAARPCAIPKAFRVGEAVGLGVVLLRSAASPWAADLPCVSARKGGAPTTTAAALTPVLSSFLSAVAGVLHDSAGHTPDAKGGSGPVTVLPPKIVREVLESLRLLQKGGMLAEEEAGPSAGLAALSAAVATLSSSKTSSEHVQRLAAQLLAGMGRPVPPVAPRMTVASVDVAMDGGKKAKSGEGKKIEGTGKGESKKAAPPPGAPHAAKKAKIA
jgi:hypothetical protein